MIDDLEERRAPYELSQLRRGKVQNATKSCVDAPCVPGHACCMLNSTRLQRETWLDEPVRLGEVARLLNVHIQTARAWCDSGRLPVLRTPTGERRVLRRNVLAILEPDIEAQP